jgi:hypothetical protein
MLGNEYEKLMAAEAQLREAYFAEICAMLLVLMILIAWLLGLVIDYLRERRIERQLRGAVDMRRGFRALKRYGTHP